MCDDVPFYGFSRYLEVISETETGQTVKGARTGMHYVMYFYLAPEIAGYPIH